MNGEPRTIAVDTRASLLDVLRAQLGLTGTKRGCDQGACGACTILLGNQRVLACLTIAARHDGEQITTVEGLAHGDQPHPMQAAFIRHDAFQCGFCTPGQIVSAVGLLSENPDVDVNEIPEQMSGNLCRCAAYPGIRAAIADAKGAR
ncbi:(2Fe-2S)-binding protein [Amycolatopsis keratiniphila]|uniref:(2Fe-2S)-binding protein n=1 Tax=Amycolatopsis keratiniphila TaxID=129921 RepID=UPI001E5C9E4A|nr:(2Fe-2S)-binding protein [Amycolatopsis keratiniphila]